MQGVDLSVSAESPTEPRKRVLPLLDDSQDRTSKDLQDPERSESHFCSFPPRGTWTPCPRLRGLTPCSTLRTGGKEGHPDRLFLDLFPCLVRGGTRDSFGLLHVEGRRGQDRTSTGTPTPTRTPEEPSPSDPCHGPSDPCHGPSDPPPSLVSLLSPVHARV